jgi:hypothetical protein
MAFPLLPGHRNHALGPIQQIDDLVLLEIGDRKQMALVERGKITGRTGCGG